MIFHSSLIPSDVGSVAAYFVNFKTGQTVLDEELIPFPHLNLSRDSNDIHI
jgi:hypothetical protein